MKNIKLIIEYDGTNYCGWQRQQTVPTVCGTLESALSEALNEKILLTGCSRTDAQVHAVSYCANFFTESTIPPERIFLAVRHLLPSDITVKSSQEVSSDFHACFSVKSKTYRYYFSRDSLFHPLLANRVWQTYDSLSFENMAKAAAHFTGTHDFEAFRNMDPASDKKTTVRTIYESSVHRCDFEGTESYYYQVTGNGFLYNMVRIITGTIVECGQGKISPDSVPDIILSKDRKKAGVTAPAQGLYLYQVNY